MEALGQTLQLQVKSSKSENSYNRELVSELHFVCCLELLPTKKSARKITSGCEEKNSSEIPGFT